jgi:hypothetical protein
MIPHLYRLLAADRRRKLYYTVIQVCGIPQTIPGGEQIRRDLFLKSW